MINPDSFTPDFEVSERLANGETLQFLGMYHHDENSRVIAEAYKESASGLAWFLVGWRTDLSVEKAVQLMDGFTDLHDISSSHRILKIRDKINTQDVKEFEWAEDDPANIGGAKKIIQQLGAGSIYMITQDFEEGTIGWSTRNAINLMTVSSTSDIRTAWIQEVIDRTISDAARVVIERNIGELAIGLRTFLDLPYGKTALTTGFSEVS